MKWKSVKRSKLYAEVWQMPMMRLAKSYAISDVGLAKICRKHNIPRPPRGYWAKKQSGQSLKQAPLPDSHNDYEITLREPDQLSKAEPALPAALEQELAKSRAVSIPIEIAANLRKAHPLVSQARQELQNADKGEDGLLIVPQATPLKIYTSKAVLQRALLLIDALLGAFETRGFKTSRGPSVIVMEVTVSFGVSEILESKREERHDHDLEGRYRFGHSRFKEVKKPSGRLALKIDDPDFYWASGCRQVWRDTKSPLENKLLSFVEGVIEFAARVKEELAKRVKEEKARQEAEQRRREEAKNRAEKKSLIKAERGRVRELYRDAKNWRRSQTIRDYIAAKRANTESQEGFADWLVWAEQQADRLDPLTSSPPSILDEDVSEPEEPSWRRGMW